MSPRLLLATAMLFTPTAAFAQGTAPAAAAPAMDATPAPAAPALCADRPAKATSACTVPRGMVQFETDLFNWTGDSDGGMRSDVILYTNPTLKYGLTSSTDIEATISPYETIRTRDALGNVSKVHGVSDLYLRVKQRLTNPDDKLQMALIPYIKVPTAKFGIGNRKVEGGLVGTAQYSLPQGFSLTVTPEIDALENDALDGHHVQLIGALNLGKTLTSKLTANAELWTAQNYDPSGTVRQYSADAALAYLASSTLQLDVGANLGLNRYTPDVQAYVGVSTRF